MSVVDRDNYLALQIRPLNQARLRFVGPMGSAVTGPYCACFELAPDSPVELDTDSDLISPPYLFPLNLREGGCPIVVSHGNFEDHRLQNLQKQLLASDLHQIHQDLQAEKQVQAAELLAQVQRERSDGWRAYGSSLGLSPIQLNTPAEASRLLLGEASGATVAQAFAVLQCLNENFWADSSHQAQCTQNPEIMDGIKKLCALTVGRTGLFGGLSDCRDPLRDILVEEKLHVYRVGDANYSSGFSTSLTVSNGFSLGQFNATEFGHGVSDSQAVGVTAGVSAGKVASIGADVSFNKSWSAFSTTVTREWTDSSVGVAADATLTVENADINLRVDEYRRCYSVRTRAEGKIGQYVCFAVQRQPMWRQERYFVIFNPGFNGSILNSNDERNRWLIQFRGERFFYHLMASLNGNFAPFNINGSSVLLADILKRSYDRFGQRTGWGDPFVLSTIAPGLDEMVLREDGTRDLPVLGFHPHRDFGNSAPSNVNDPGARASDNGSNF